MRKATPQPAHASPIAVVIPCYRVARQVAGVIRDIPDFVSLIVAVDDACPEQSGEVARRVNDPRVVVVQHRQNQGVGGAMLTGYQVCLERGAEVIAKIDGDGQMDPACLGQLVEPLLRREADYAKGNRWHHSMSLTQMPALRRLGNLGLSFCAKLASGHWRAFDPCNGYTAIHADALRQIEVGRVAKDYFFEISMLVELGIAGATIYDVAIPAIYGEETSSLRIGRVLRTFPMRLMRALARRVWHRHFIREFGPTGLFLISGGLLVAWALLFGVGAWTRSLVTGVPATSGTVMIAAMPFLMGFQLLLQALVMDITEAARRPLCSNDTPRISMDSWSKPAARQAA